MLKINSLDDLSEFPLGPADSEKIERTRPVFSAHSSGRTLLIPHNKYIVRLRQNFMKFRHVFQSRGVISSLA
jgi:hypothetical protein